EAVAAGVVLPLRFVDLLAVELVGPDELPVVGTRRRPEKQEQHDGGSHASSRNGGGFGGGAGITGRRLMKTSSPTTFTGKHFMWIRGFPVYSPLVTSNSHAWSEQRTYLPRNALFESWKPAWGQKSREA